MRGDAGRQPHRHGNGRGMSASESRFVAIWASHEARARLWFRLFLLTAASLILSLVTTIRVWNRPREVIRIGCDRVLFEETDPSVLVDVDVDLNR